MKEKEVWRNVRLYKWFVLLREPMFWGPTLILFIQKAGMMSLSEIYLMEAVVLLLAVILEIPTGAIADLIGRKNTIVAGTFFMFLSAVIMAFINSPLLVWISNIVCTIGVTLNSGADQAFLYDSLKEIKQEKEYHRIVGHAWGNFLFVRIFTCLLAGFLSEISLALPFLLSIPNVLIAVIIVIRFKEPMENQRFTFGKQLELMKTSFLFVASHKMVRWIICFCVLIALAHKIVFFAYNPYFESVKLNLKYYGVAFALMNVAGWIFSHHSSAIEKKLGEFGSALSLVLITGIPVIIMGAFPTIQSLLLILLLSAGRGFIQPFSSHFLNKHLDSNNRATVISIKSAYLGLANFLVLTAFGQILKLWTLATSLMLLGISVLIIGSIILCQYRKIFNINPKEHQEE